jgi:hypothetical protein
MLCIILRFYLNDWRPIPPRVLAEKQKDNLLQDCLFGSNVGMGTASTNILMQDVLNILKQ